MHGRNLPNFSQTHTHTHTHDFAVLAKTRRFTHIVSEHKIGELWAALRTLLLLLLAPVFVGLGAKFPPPRAVGSLPWTHQNMN